MTLTLHLGVVDIAYVNDEAHTQPPVRKGKRGGKSKGSQWRREDIIGGDAITTTGQVAELLEDKYHILEHFWQAHGQEIAAELANALAGSLETVPMGGPPSPDPMAGGTSATKAMFTHFLTNREMDRLGYPGIPTEAAKKGVNPRLAHPYSKFNPERPSFISSGTYESSFMAWVDGEMGGGS